MDRSSVHSPVGLTLVCFPLVVSAVLVLVCFLLVAPAVLVLVRFLLVASAVLALVCFPLVAPAPEPIPHSTNGGGRPDARHELQVIVVLGPVCFLLVGPRRSRSCTA